MSERDARGPNEQMLALRFGPPAAAFLAESQQLVPLGRIDAPISRTPAGIVVLPAIGSVHGRARRRCLLEQPDRLPHDRLLHVAPPRMPARIAEWKVGE